MLNCLDNFRVVREVMSSQCDSFDTWKITPNALKALQASAELYVVQVLEDSYLCAIHRGRATLLPKDMKLVSYLRKLN